jgi:hypothetical protein
MTIREKQHLLRDMGHVRGLLPLLMNQRNRQGWSVEDKALLIVYLRQISHISRYLVVLAIPGGLIMIPALSWWLDRRRRRIFIDPTSRI